jgi:hypothetical protein
VFWPKAEWLKIEPLFDWRKNDVVFLEILSDWAKIVLSGLKGGLWTERSASCASYHTGRVNEAPSLATGH